MLLSGVWMSISILSPNSDGNGLRGCGDKELMECHCRRFRSDFALTRRAIPAALCSNAHTRPKPRLREMELSGRCCFSFSRGVPFAQTFATVNFLRRQACTRKKSCRMVKVGKSSNESDIYTIIISSKHLEKSYFFNFQRFKN